MTVDDILAINMELRAARRARIETFKAIFLVIGFLAAGFVIGCFVNQHRTVSPVAPPPWWQTGGSI